MKAQSTETIIAVYRGPEPAAYSIERLRRLEKAGMTEVAGAAVLTKSTDGKLKVEELHDLSAHEGAKRGALLGAIVGLIFPPSLFVSVLAEPGIGGAAGQYSDSGLRNKALEDIGERLRADHSTIVIVLEGDRTLDQVLYALEGYEKLYRQTLDPETFQSLKQVS